MPRVLPVFALVLAVGCSAGPRPYPVEGVLVFADGRPAVELDGYAVEFESVDRIDGRPVSASGTVRPDGTFRLTTRKDGDGAFPGKHRVLLAAPVAAGDTPVARSVLADKYGSFDTSGLEATVVPGTNRVELKVERRRR